MKEVWVCVQDKRPLLFTSRLAAPGWREKEREDGGRIEGHIRQWGLCGHLSETDGKALDPERRDSE